MMRSLSALFLLVGLVAACGSDDDPQAELNATATATPTPTPTRTPTPTPTTTPTPTPTPTPTQALTPAPKPTKTIKPAPVLTGCAFIWKPGSVLPKSYSGCAVQDGEEAYAPEPCNSGGTWARYSSPSGRFVAKLGGTIYKRDPNLDGNYESTYEGCTGEG